MNQKKNNNNEYKKVPQRPFTYGSLWKYALIFLAAWVLYSYFASGWQSDTIEIPYSALKKQIINDNVSEIVFDGQNLSGKFTEPYISSADTTTEGKAYKNFKSVKPPVEDKGLLNILENNNVVIKSKTEGSNWLFYVLILAIPWVLIIGYSLYLRRKMQGSMGNMMKGGGLFGIGKSKAKKFTSSKTKESYDDVAGLENAKKDLREIVEYLKDPQKFQSIGASIPKGILLMGPPGTGKTLLARATAGEADVSFYSISASEFIEMFVGVGASRVRDMFETAKKDSPSIIFIDEIDSVGRSRGTGLGGGHDEREQTLNQILSEMDGFETNESVIVLAATNRPDVLDPALIRPGRFDRQITLEKPKKDSREKILKIHSKDKPVSDKVDLSNIASRTVGFSGADLKNLVNEAALLAGRKNKKTIEPDDFDEAKDKIMLGAKREEVIEDEEKKVIAFHEAGHALLTKLLPNTDPIQKVTIIPRGRSLGVTEQMPEFERHNYNKKYLLDFIAVTLGGRAAEKIKFNEITNGAANDLEKVTKIARNMVCHWGMSDKIGPVKYNIGEEHLFLGKEMSQPREFSEHSAKLIDEEIRSIIQEQMDRAENLLKKNEVKLEALAESLLENETMERNEIEWLMDKIDDQDKEGESKK